MIKRKCLLLALAIGLCPLVLAAQPLASEPSFAGEIRLSGHPGDQTPTVASPKQEVPNLESIDTFGKGAGPPVDRFEVPVSVSVEAYDKLREDSPHLPPAEVIQHQTGPGVSVGTYYCELQAHSPHKGSCTRTVKAKASGYCEFTPNWRDIPPPPWLTLWVLRMDLYPVTVPGPLSRAYHPRIGCVAQWRQNAGLGGTQVDSGRCTNGLWVNSVRISVYVPPGFAATVNPVVSRSRPAVVTGC